MSRCERDRARALLRCVAGFPAEGDAVTGVAGDWMFTRRPPARGANRSSPTRAGPHADRGTDPGAEDPEALGKAETAERELERCVRAAAPTRRVLCALAARAVEIRSWSRLGFARAGDQMRERQGISARSLQELARVHRSLAGAPGVDAAFQTGRIGWTTARALARLGSIDDEALWLRRAKALPLPDLERAVRRARAEGDGPSPSEQEDEPRQDRFPVACTRPVRAKWLLGRELACRVAGERLPSWECAEVVAAETSSATPPASGRSDLDEDLQPGSSLGQALELSRRAGLGAEEGPEDSGVGESGSAARSRPPEQPPCGAPAPLPPELGRLLDGLAEADAFDLDRRLRRAVRLERTHEARIGPLLRRVLAARAYRRRGYWDRERYLEERLGMCPRKARALVRIERVLDGAPALADAYRSGRLSWVQTHALAPLLEVGLDARRARAWLRRAGRVTVRRLEDDVRTALARADLESRQSRAMDADREEEPGMEDPEMNDRKIGALNREKEDAMISFHAPADSARFFRAVLETVRERLSALRGAPATEGEALEAMLDHAIQAWSQGDEHARREYRIFERDGWRCAVPGCTSYRNLQVHHIVFRSQGGGDEPENLVTLCAWHHQRGVHGGLVRITGRAPDRLRFELGLREGKEPLVVYDSQERLVGGS